MGVIKGQNLRLVVNDKYIAFATACTIHLSANLEESSTKDSENDFQEQELTGLTWDISSDALYVVSTSDIDGSTSDTLGFNGENLLGLMLNQAKVQVLFTCTHPTSNTQQGGNKNRNATGNKFGGYAWISDLSINATNKQNTSYSIQLTGDGPLAKIGASSANQGIFDSNADI